MNVVIVCADCRGKSQVDESSLGGMVQCPLCGKPTVAALPAAVPLLSLDEDAPASGVVSAPRVPDRVPTPPRTPLRKGIYAFISLLLTIAIMGGIYAAFRYGDGQIPDRSWLTFTPPGEKSSIRMPGESTVERIPAEGFASQGGQRFRVHRWFEKADAEFGWVDLDATKAVASRFDDLVAALRDREVKRLDGKLTGESRVNFVVKNRKFEVRQYLIDLPKGKAVMQIYFDPDIERLKFQTVRTLEPHTLVLDIPTGWDLKGPPLSVEVPVEVRQMHVEPGQSLRLYFAIASGKNVTRETPWVPKFLGSLVPE